MSKSEFDEKSRDTISIKDPNTRTFVGKLKKHSDISKPGSKRDSTFTKPNYKALFAKELAKMKKQKEESQRLMSQNSQRTNALYLNHVLVRKNNGKMKQETFSLITGRSL